MTKIEGASPEQRAMLEEILEGLDGTELELLSIERPEAGRHARRGEVALRASHGGDIRAHWHAMLVAGAFARRAELEGLPAPVVLVQPGSAGPITAGPIDLEPPSDRDAVVLESLARSAGGAELAELRIRRPYGFAPELTLRVREPHSFLRVVIDRVLAPFAARAWEGYYVEVLDGDGRGWVRGCSTRGGGCISSTRRDLECCGWQGLSHPIEWRPPVCPVYDRRTN
jgi:hypothetical protein